MINTRPMGTAERLNQPGVPPKFGPDISKLLIKVMRKIADRQTVTFDSTDIQVEDIGLDAEEAEQFLRAVTERDDIEILSVDDALELGKYAWSGVLEYARLERIS